MENDGLVELERRMLHCLLDHSPLGIPAEIFELDDDPARVMQVLNALRESDVEPCTDLNQWIAWRFG